MTTTKSFGVQVGWASALHEFKKLQDCERPFARQEIMRHLSIGDKEYDFLLTCTNRMDHEKLLDLRDQQIGYLFEQPEEVWGPLITNSAELVARGKSHLLTSDWAQLVGRWQHVYNDLMRMHCEASSSGGLGYLLDSSWSEGHHEALSSINKKLLELTGGDHCLTTA